MTKLILFVLLFLGTSAQAAKGGSTLAALTEMAGSSQSEVMQIIGLDDLNGPGKILVLAQVANYGDAGLIEQLVESQWSCTANHCSYPNGNTAFNGTNWYYINGNTAFNGTNWYYPNGNTAFNGTNWYYPNGNTAFNGTNWYYINGNTAFNGTNWYYINGNTAFNGTNWYYPNGNTAFNGTNWYYPNGNIAYNGSTWYDVNGSPLGTSAPDDPGSILLFLFQK
jgi:hypothetical protein